MNDASDELRAAAEYIAEYGWHQGGYRTYEDTDGEHPRVCALGALSEVRAGYQYGYDAAFRLGVHLMDEGLAPVYEGVEPISLIPGWNDAPERTAEDVILAFKRAAADEPAP